MQRKDKLMAVISLPLFASRSFFPPPNIFFCVLIITNDVRSYVYCVLYSHALLFRCANKRESCEEARQGTQAMYACSCTHMFWVMHILSSLPLFTISRKSCIVSSTLSPNTWSKYYTCVFYFMNTHVYLHKIRDDVIKTTCFSRELRVKVTEDQLRVFLDSLCMKKIRGNRKKLPLEKNTLKRKNCL